METTKKITKATLKSFINKNKNNLFINTLSSFDGMTDMCEQQKDGFKKATKTDSNLKNTLGIIGAWVVSSWNSYNEYKTENFIGIEVYNCCGNFIIAIKK